MKKGLVTVMTPCYNGEKFVSVLIDSLINQTYTNIEFIFIDDGSTDNTEKVVKQYKKQLKEKGILLKYIKQKNAGQAAAVNYGLQYVEGEYFVQADSDDYYEDNAIETMVNFLDTHKDYNAVRGNAAFRKDNEQKEIIEIRRSKELQNTDLFMNYIIEKDIYCFPGVIMMRMSQFLKNNKGRDIYVNKAGQNWQIILPAVYKSKTGYIDVVVYNYLVRENSHSRQKETMKDVLARMQNHRKILKKTVSKIIDDREEKKKYLKIIKDKYDTREKEYIKYKLHHWTEE